MKVVWKFQLDRITNTVAMPQGAQPLHVAVQNGHPMLWALVEEDAQLEERIFEIVATGQAMPADSGNRYLYIGTFQRDWFVSHVFEVQP